MKHNRRCRKLIAILLCICLMVPMISGCGEKKEEETKQTSSGTLVFQYGNNLVTKGEVYIYIETVRERYEMQYGSDVWQTVLPDGGAGTSMENLTREEVVNEIVRVKTLCAHADELGITLGDDELTELNQKADDFCEGLTDEQLQNMEITKEKAEKVMQENAIASKVEAKMQTMSPKDILETYGQDVYDLLYNMENGQYSTVVETQYGYHVFQMIALTDQTKTNEQKIVLYNQQVQEALSDTLTKWQAQIDPIFKYPDSVDMDVYDTIVNDTVGTN